LQTTGHKRQNKNPPRPIRLGRVNYLVCLGNFDQNAICAASSPMTGTNDIV